MAKEKITLKRTKDVWALWLLVDQRPDRDALIEEATKGLEAAAKSDWGEGTTVKIEGRCCTVMRGKMYEVLK